MICLCSWLKMVMSHGGSGNGPLGQNHSPPATQLDEGVLPADSAPQLPDQNGAFLADFSEWMPHLATRGRERVTFLCTVRQTWAPLTSGPGVDDDMVGWAWMHRRGTEHRRSGGRARVTPGLKLSVPGARVQLHGEEAERGHCGGL